MSLPWDMLRFPAPGRGYRGQGRGCCLQWKRSIHGDGRVEVRGASVWGRGCMCGLVGEWVDGEVSRRTCGWVSGQCLDGWLNGRGGHLGK